MKRLIPLMLGASLALALPLSAQDIAPSGFQVQDLRIAAVRPETSEPFLPGLAFLDGAAPTSYDAGLDRVSGMLLGAAVLLPLSFAFEARRENLIGAGLVYSGGLALAFVAKEVLKDLVPRARPYALSGGPLEGELLAEAFESFPSGHTTLAFCAATSLSILAGNLYPDSRMRPWIVAGAWGMALGSAALRVASGSHFPSDVLAGAVVGAAIGAASGFAGRLLLPRGN